MGFEIKKQAIKYIACFQYSWTNIILIFFLLHVPFRRFEASTKALRILDQSLLPHPQHILAPHYVNSSSRPLLGPTTVVFWPFHESFLIWFVNDLSYQPTHSWCSWRIIRFRSVKGRNCTVHINTLYNFFVFKYIKKI